MGVTREDVSSNSAILRVKVTPADYEKNVANAIEKTRKQANIPGFRKGHVPASLVKKQYGKSILADELNKVVNDFLNSFITENKIEILGNPIPFEKEENGEFQQEVGF